MRELSIRDLYTTVPEREPSDGRDHDRSTFANAWRSFGDVECLRFGYPDQVGKHGKPLAGYVHTRRVGASAPKPRGLRWED